MNDPETTAAKDVAPATTARGEVSKPASPEPAAAAPATAGAAAASGLQDDIARILHDVKLPDRPAYRASGDAIAKKVAPPAPHTDALSTTPAGTVPEAQQPPEEDSSITSLHTLKDDLQHAARNQKISVIKAAALEEEKRHHGVHEVNPEQKRNATPFIIAIVLIVLGCAALFGVYVTLPKPTPPTSPVSQSLVFAEQTTLLPLGDMAPPDLKRTIASVRAQNLTLGSIMHITPTIGTGDTARPVSIQEFFVSLGIHAPDELLHALRGDFFFGFHSADKNGPVFIIPVSSYEHAFAGMLAWENSMNADFAPIVTLVPPLQNTEQGTFGVPRFSDEVIRNYDVRALRDGAGQIVLYYSFPSKDILVIAESPYTFAEVLTRLRAQRLI